MKQLRAAFLLKVKKQGKMGCWEWTGYRTDKGYGQFCWNGKVGPAHRFSLIAHGVVLPAGMYVCHKCDNPGCVNPAHLFIGTAKDNMADCMAKGRNWPPPVHRLLDDERAKFILTAYKPFKITAPMLARMFKVGVPVIRGVLFGKAWRHIKAQVERAQRDSK